MRFRVEQKHQFLRCSYCDGKIQLQDTMRSNFDTDETEQRAYALDREAERNLDNESKDLILVGEATTIAGQAGQIFKRLDTCDHGIDAEIEFKDRRGRATGKGLGGK